jgi:WD40 repeat protein/serine/threonine protein kinase
MTSPGNDRDIPPAGETAGRADFTSAPPAANPEDAVTPTRLEAPLLMPSAESSWPERLGEYHLVRLVGKGGMGLVFEAVQEPLDRRVALKVLPPTLGFAPVAIERFRREARAAANLHHTNIVPVFGSGEQDGVFYYAMQFIEGQGLDEVLKELRVFQSSSQLAAATVPALTDAGYIAQSLWRARTTPPGPTPTPPGTDRTPVAGVEEEVPVVLRPALQGVKAGEAAFYAAVAHMVAQAADALAYAHEQGILHRDVKPSNLLLDRRGTVWLADFGLARSEDDADLSQPGDVVGTLRYLAPERFEGPATPGSDIYSLGVTLYEMLTLQPAVSGSGREQIIQQLSTQEPPAPRCLDPRIPRDLETICLKAMARDPARRYVSARALADDLGRYLRGEPVQARRVGVVERLVKWGRRHPAVAILSAALLLVSTIGLALVLWQWQEARTARDQAEGSAATAREEEQKAVRAAEAEREARLATTRALDRAERNLYFQSLALARNEWLAGNVGRSAEILRDCPPGLRRWEWGYLDGLCKAYRWKSDEHEAVNGLAFRPDGQVLASVGGDRYLHLRDAATGKPLRKMLHGGEVTAVAWSADGKWVASGGSSGDVKVWNAADGSLVRALTGHNHRVAAVAFTPDGKEIISSDQDGIIKVRSLETGKERRSWQAHDRHAGVLSLHPDGKILATGGWDDGVKLWDLGSGEELRRFERHKARICAIAFAPDGKTVASAGDDRVIRLWTTDTAQELRVFHGHTESLTQLAFCRNGAYLASASADQTVRIWDVATGAQMAVFRGHDTWIRSLAVTADGALVASGCSRELKVWDIAAGWEADTLPGHGNLVWGVAFAPNGRTLASASWDKTVKLWDLASRRLEATLSGHDNLVQCVAIRPSGRPLLASGASDKTVRLWDLATNQTIATLTHPGGVFAVAFSPDGKLLASGDFEANVKVFDSDSATELWSLPRHGGPVFNLAFSPDSRLLAVANGESEHGSVRLWNVAERKQVWHSKKATFVVAFHPEGRILASVDDRRIYLLDAATGEVLHTLKGHAQTVNGVAFSPDGERLFSISHDQTLKVWDVTTLREILSLSAGTKMPRRAGEP